MMDASAFDDILTSDLGTLVQWSASHRCPCAQSDGGVDSACPLCHGEAVLYDAFSSSFRIGLTGMSAKALEHMKQRFGPGIVGDSMLSIPSTAPCYSGISPNDRFKVVDAVDIQEWNLVPGPKVKLPSGSVVISCLARNNAGTALVAVTTPTPDGDGRISAAVSMTIRFSAPRLLEVVQGASQLRSWQPGMPKKLVAKLVDVSVRW